MVTNVLFKVAQIGSCVRGNSLQIYILTFRFWNLILCQSVRIMSEKIECFFLFKFSNILQKCMILVLKTTKYRFSFKYLYSKTYTPGLPPGILWRCPRGTRRWKFQSWFSEGGKNVICTCPRHFFPKCWLESFNVTFNTIPERADHTV